MSLFDDARARAEREVAANRDKAEKEAVERQTKILEGLQLVSTALQAANEQNQQLQARLEALEKGGRGSGGGSGNFQRGVPEYDPYAEIDIEKPETIGRAIQHGIQAAMKEAVPTAVKGSIEETFGPQMREAAAIQQYQKDHPDFDLDAVKKFLAQDPDTAALVDAARKQGAIATGLELAQTRMALSAATKKEAGIRARRERSQQLVAETRPDAQIMGGGAASPEQRNVGTKPLDLNTLSGIYAQADQGNWSPFEKEMHANSLPSEEWFQALAQS